MPLFRRSSAASPAAPPPLVVRRLAYLGLAVFVGHAAPVVAQGGGTIADQRTGRDNLPAIECRDRALYVTDTAWTPIAYARVEWWPQGGAVMHRQTDSGGVGCLPAGAGDFEIRRIGFRPTRIAFVHADTQRVVVLRLVPIPHALARVETTGSATDPNAAHRALGDLGAGHGVVLTAALRHALPALDAVDPLRSLALVAPVAVRGDFSPGVGAYGAPADQTRIEIEGHTVLSIQHIAGLVPALPEGTIGSVRVAPGSGTAQTGGALGGVVSMTVRRDDAGGAHGTVVFSPIAAGATASLRSPAGRAALVVGVRGSTVDWLADRVKPGSFPYRFRDAFAHGTVVGPAGIELTVTALQAGDTMHYDGDGNEKSAYARDDVAWSTGFTGARLLVPLAGRTRLIARAGENRFTSAITVPALSMTMSGALVQHDAALTLERPVVMGGTMGTVLLGAGTTDVRSTIGVRMIGILSSEPPDSLRSEAAWLEWDGAPSGEHRWGARLGLRYESIPVARWSAVLPRATFLWQVRPGLRAEVGGGRVAQWMHSSSPDGLPGSPIELWMLSGRGIPVATANEMLGGLSIGATPALPVLRVATWMRRGTNVPDRLAALDPSTVHLDVRGVGAQSDGVDLRLAPVLTDHWTMLLGYTLSRSERSDVDAAGRPVTWAAADDRRHRGTATLMWRGRARSATIAWQGTSGAPVTEQVGASLVWTPSMTGGQTLYWPGPTHAWSGERNAARLPALSRVDVRVAQRWLFGLAHDRVLEAHLGVLNVTNRANAFAYEWDFFATPATRTLRAQLPILPSAGLTFTF